RLGDEDDDKLEDLELEDAKPAIPTKDFIKQLQDETSWEEEEDSDLPDVVEIGEVVVLEDLDALDQKITDDPENDALWARKARLLSKAGSFEKAISCYDKAAELNVDMEAEYKKLILEILHGTAISDSPDELDELDLDTDIVDTDAAKARLKEIDEDLALFPGTESLLQEKGELLDQLGMHEAALECYNQVIQSSYKGIEAIARKKKYSDYPDSLQIGFTDGDGRVNGRINGILLGRVNGRINGLTNGRVNGLTNGRINGLVNGRSKVNGLTNGRINGLVNGRSKVNGLTNGRINGLVNGRSKVNGLVNGKVNGLVNGLTNGKVNGLPFTFGGLINGMGLINGDGLVSSRSRLHRSKAKGYASSLWRTRVSVMVVLIFMMMIVPVLTNMMVEDGSYGMSIDGDFADWREFTSYHDSSQDQISNDDLNIIETKINFRPPNIFLYLRVDGDILGGRSTNDTSGVDSIFIFVDTDSDSSTGYNVSGMGADVLLAIHGWVNTAQSADVLRFDNELDHDDWKGFEYSHRTVTALQDGELELRVALNELDTYSQPILLIMTQDSFGERDVADSMITPLYGTLRVSMTEAVDGDILLPGESDAGMIRLESFGRDSEVLDMTFGLQGQLEVDGMDNLRLLMDTDGDGLYNPLVDEEIEATPVQNGRSFTFTLEDSLEIEANEQLDIFLAFDVAQATAAENVGVKIISLAVSDGVLVQIAENSGSLHNIGAADTIEIDGAFGDWENVGQNIDAANDVTNGNINHNQTRINRNVDISDYRLSVDDRLLVYTSVAGVAMGGIDVPMIRYRPVYVPPANVTPTPIPDSDNDGVPDVHDGPDGSLAHDFDNDGVDDADSGGDRDGDGIIDYGYDGGQDYWLNTTIPLDFDAEYANRTVSRFIGPIAPVQVQIKGLDYLSIYIDSDNNISTGAYINGRLGADHMALVSGRNNVIVSSELYRYDRSFLIPWVKVADMTSALDYHRMEMGVPLSLLGISALDEFSISLEMSDWKHSQDVSDEPLDHIALATGTRAAPIDDEPRAPPTPVPLVTIAKSVDLRTAEPGDYLNYTITLTNKRKAETAAFVWVNDTLPSGVTYVSDTSGLTPSVNGDTYTYPYTNLVADTTITFVITVRVDDTTADGTTLLNNVDVDFTDSTGTPYGTDTDSASTDCVRPDISVEKVANTTTAYPGTLVTYTIWYNNTGGGNAGDVWINDTIPGGTIFQSSTPAPTTVNGDDYTWYFPNVRKNTVNSITITVMVDPLATPGTTITNWASLNYTALNGHAFAEQSDSAVINVIIIPEFSTIAPLALGILGLAFVGFRRRKEVIR
ncbi:MAG: DUF11 domain-containing protein, partial [Thermoplasmata archaeon]|nr:DUF11 domain-containing protein [Thermoplasmata archaeon]